ncbi:MAG: hypothetical protein QXH91_04040 [Candidatus Bathyarchaeia archaeon]
MSNILNGNLHEIKYEILKRIIANPVQHKNQATNTIAYISEKISHCALEDTIEELGLKSDVVYNSQYNGLSPKKVINDKGPDLIVQSLRLGNEVKVRNNPRGYYTEKEFNEVVSKFNKDFSYKFLTLYHGYTKERIDEVRQLANKSGIYVIDIPYPIPYTKIGNACHFSPQEIEEYIKNVYSIVKGKYKYYLGKIIRSLHTSSLDNNIDHGMDCSVLLLLPIHRILHTILLIKTLLVYGTLLYANATCYSRAYRCITGVLFESITCSLRMLRAFSCRVRDFASLINSLIKKDCSLNGIVDECSSLGKLELVFNKFFCKFKRKIEQLLSFHHMNYDSVCVGG